MKEPDLEEERLLADLTGDQVRVIRRTLADEVPPVTVLSPAGKSQTIILEKGKPGHWSYTLNPDEVGLYRFTQGELSTVAAVGPLNPLEFNNPVSTTKELAPIVAKSNGTAMRVINGLPVLRRVADGQSTSGQTGRAPWLGLVKRDRYQVRDVSQYPLAPPLLAMVLLIGLVMAAWRTEGR